MLTTDHTPAGVEKALREGPYGRCVFACDNDVVDHQVVNLEFEDGTTAGFITTAFAVGGRDYFVMGDTGSLRFAEENIVHTDFRGGPAGTVTVHPVGGGDTSTVLSGHGGGDFGLMRQFVAAIRDGDTAAIRSGPAESLESHLIVFAAEKARKNGCVMQVPSV
jgi:predicted dehydrogenase